MAKSFTTDSECSVGDFDGKPNGWEDFCDCMFLEPPRSIDTYWSNGVQLLPGVVSGGAHTGDTSSPLYVLMLPQVINQGFKQIVVYGLMNEKIDQVLAAGFQFEIRAFSDGQPTKTTDWYKCQRHYCALPFGCPNPRTGDNDPFNVDVKMWAAPWTDFGSVARGIPTRSQGLFWQDLAGVLSIDFKQYEAVNMWKQYWTNPGNFAYLVAKMAGLVGLGSFVVGGPAWAAAGWVFVNNPIDMVRMVLIQVVAEGKDPIKYIFEPMIEGSISSLEFFSQAFPAGFETIFAARPMALAGAIFQKVCKDQIASGKIEEIRTPEIRALIIFFAKNAYDIGKKLDSVAVDPTSVAGIFTLIEKGMTAIAINKDIPSHDGVVTAGWPQGTPIPGSIASWAAQFSTVMGVASIIAEGVARGTNAWEVLDSVIYKIFGFRWGGPGGLQESLAKGPEALQKLFGGASKAETRANSKDPQTGLVALDTIGNFFQGATITLSDLANGLGSFGGAIQGFVDKFREFGAQFNTVNAEIKATALDPAVAVISSSNKSALSTQVDPVKIVPFKAATATITAGTKTANVAASPVLTKTVSAGYAAARPVPAPAPAPTPIVSTQTFAPAKVTGTQFLATQTASPATIAALPQTVMALPATGNAMPLTLPAKETTVPAGPRPRPSNELSVTPSAPPKPQAPPPQVQLLAPPVTVAPKKSAAAFAVTGAVGGALVGGPVGAAIGGAVALGLSLMGKNSQTQQVSGFGYWGGPVPEMKPVVEKTKVTKVTGQEFIATVFPVTEKTKSASPTLVNPKDEAQAKAEAQVLLDRRAKELQAQQEQARLALEMQAKQQQALEAQARLARQQAEQAAKLAQAQAQEQALKQAQAQAQAAQALALRQQEAAQQEQAMKAQQEAQLRQAAAQAQAQEAARQEAARQEAARARQQAEAQAKVAAGQKVTGQEFLATAEKQAAPAKQLESKMNISSGLVSGKEFLNQSTQNELAAKQAQAQAEAQAAAAQVAVLQAKMAAGVPSPLKSGALVTGPAQMVTAQDFLRTIAAPESTSAKEASTAVVDLSTGAGYKNNVLDVKGPSTVPAKPGVDTSYFPNPTESAPLEQKKIPVVTGEEFLAMQTNTNEILGPGATVGSKTRELPNPYITSSLLPAPASSSSSNMGVWFGIAALVGGALYLKSRK